MYVLKQAVDIDDGCTMLVVFIYWYDAISWQLITPLE